jgi:hypothetical protein
MSISFRFLGRRLSFLTSAFFVLAGFTALPSPSHAQEVYFGVADQWDDLLKTPDQWKFVRENADGFYVNFIEMDWMKNSPKRMNPEKLKKTAQLFTHKNALIESDMHASTEDDQRYIRDLQTAGFFLPYTSLNYGWSAERANNLKTFQLLAGQTPRVNLVQLGPWTIGGDIKGDAGSTDVAKNAHYRNWIKESDGVSTDGPMGLWQMDAGKMRTGSFSVVTYAASLKKKSLVMLCPYGAGNKLYTPAQALSMSQQCVREHEDAGAIPTIWSVFEYATDIAAVPEAVAGKPISTTSGIAYWLIHHIQDPDRVARLSIPKQPGITTKTALLTPIGEKETILAEGAEITEATVTAPTPTAGKPWTITCELNNDSSWLDLCPVLSAETNDPNHSWDISYTLGGVDVTKAMQKGEGVVCVGDLRLWHQSKQTLVITLTPRKQNATASPLGLHLKLKPHPSQLKRLQQQIVFRVG